MKLYLASFAVVVIFRFIHIESKKYLYIQSFIYLMIPNLGYISMESLYELQSKDW